MRRKLFTFLATVSLLLCAATVALWVRSVVAPSMYLRMKWDPISRIHRQDQVGLFGGGLVVGVVRVQVDPAPASDQLWRTMQQPWRLMGNERYRGRFPLRRRQLWFFDNQPPRRSRTMPASSSHWSVSIWLWPFAAVAAVLPGVWLGRTVRLGWRKQKGCCPHCGYDMRATPERCPECGEPAAA